MNIAVKEHPLFGRSLSADNGCVEVIIPLEFGLRIGHFSLIGEHNVFFEQPRDMTDLSTPDGWRVQCGHRLWLAPESEKVYCPDNAPIHYEVVGERIVLTQQEDPWLHVVKRMEITFDRGASLQIKHSIRNTSDEDITCSLWAISSMAPGGVEELSFALRDGGYDHWHRISMWDYTSLGDERAEYRRDGIRLTHVPMEQKYKIGVGHPDGPVRYTNKGVTFVKHFDVKPEMTYPDANVSFETFMCKHMVEIESLSPLATAKPGEWLSHSERWELVKG